MNAGTTDNLESGSDRRAQRRVSTRQIVEWIQGVMLTGVAITILNAFTGVASARALGPAGKGLYNAVMLWASVAAALAAGGFNPAVIVLYGEADEDGRRSVLTAGLLLAIAWSLAVTLGILTIVPEAISHLGPTTVWLTRLALIIVPFSTFVGVLQTFMQAERAFSWFNVLRLAGALSFAIPLGLLWLSKRLTPLNLVEVALTSSVATGLFIVAATITYMRRRRFTLGRPRGRVVKRLALLSSRFYAVGLASVFNVRLDGMLTTMWLVARDIGLYTVASSSLSAVSILSGSLQTVFLPVVAGDTPSEIVRRTETAFRRVAWLVLTTAIIAVIMAGPGIRLLYGPKYAGALVAVWGLAPTTISFALLGILYQGCFALHDAVAPLIGEMCGAISGAALLWAWVPTHGIFGAALATSCSYVFDLAVVLYVWSRKHPAGALCPRLEDGRIVAQTIGTRLAALFRRIGAAFSSV